ncbi:MAG: response regulator [Desulfobacteraceae bacterium]|nr:response regulator [Desulfobacteraceae bacterium]
MPNVLVIDDERMICDLIKQALGRLDISVDTAENAMGGIHQFENGDYDLVITDVRMPGVDGHTVVHHIRKSKRDKTPVIGVSGTPWLLQNGDFDEVFSKPFAIQSLIEKVRDLTKMTESADRPLPAAVGSF